ncbi:MAG: ComF family protein [Planctomycetota bacterium]
MGRSSTGRSWLAWRRLARELRAACLDLMLPPHCPGCGAAASELERGRDLCAPCRAHLQELPPGGCRRCGQPLPDAGPCRADHGLLVGLAWACAPFRYAGTGGALVRRLKLSGDFGALPLLAAAMAGAAARRTAPATGSDGADWRHAVLVPVPLHRLRRRRRGYDQAALLAREVALRLGVRAAGALRRTRHTLPQGDPRVRSRPGNVDGAFTVVRPQAVVGRAVVLIDDVATSGATARACAAELRRAGCMRVALLTACRA